MQGECEYESQTKQIRQNFSSQYLLRKYVDISGQTGWKNPRNGLWARSDSLIFKYVEYYKYHPPALEQRYRGTDRGER
jgi:hypothetical protein